MFHVTGALSKTSMLSTRKVGASMSYIRIRDKVYAVVSGGYEFAGVYTKAAWYVPLVVGTDIRELEVADAARAKMFGELPDRSTQCEKC